MLKPSPLKHKEDGHDVLDQVAHDKAHLGEGVIDDHEVGGTFTNGDRSYIKQKDGWHIEGEDGETKLVNQEMFREHQLKGSKPEIKKEEKVEEENKPKYLDFNQWHTNDDGETSMVDKLRKLHPDYEIAEAVAGDDVVSIKRKGDKEGVEVRLQTKWTDNADHSAGYRKYLDYVGGENVDKTLNNYHDKTIGKYKQVGKDGEAESDEAFFERTKPKLQGGYTPYTEIGGVRYHSGVLPSANGKRSSNPYRNASGGEATQQEKEMYEQMKFLHDLKNRADETKSKSLSDESKGETNIVLQSKQGGGGSDKNLVKDVGDETTFTAADYGSFVKDEAYEDFQEKALEIWTAERVKGSEALEKATDEFLPEARTETTEHFQPRYDALQEEQQAIIDENKEAEEAKLQEEINAGLWKGKSKEEINAEYNKRLNSYLEPMQAKYDKVNEDAKKYLNDLYKKEQEDPESDFSKAMDKINASAQSNIDNIQKGFFNTWKPEPNLISEAKYEEISQVLDKGGFANLNSNDKKLALTKQWNMLSDKLDDDMSPEELAKAEKEFWSVNYSKLDKDKDGKFSQFMMKGVAQDQLGIFNDVIDLKVNEVDEDGNKKYEDKRIEIGRENGKPIYRTISAKEQALAALKKDNPAFKNYNQVSRYLDKIIDSPETMSNSGMANFWRGLTSKQGHEYVPFLSGVVNTGDSYTIKKITDKILKIEQKKKKVCYRFIK